MSRVDQGVHEIPIVCQNQGAGGIVVQPTDREYAFVGINQIHDGFSVFVVGGRRDHPGGFVKEKIDFFLWGGKRASVDFNSIGRLNGMAGTGYGFPVDFDAALENPFLRRPPGSRSGGGNDFLNPFHAALPFGDDSFFEKSGHKFLSRSILRFLGFGCVFGPDIDGQKNGFDPPFFDFEDFKGQSFGVFPD